MINAGNTSNNTSNTSTISNTTKWPSTSTRFVHFASMSMLLLAAVLQVQIPMSSSFSFQSCTSTGTSTSTGISSNYNYKCKLHTQLNSSKSPSPWDTAATYNRKNTYNKNNSNNNSRNSSSKYKSSSYKQRDPTTELNRTKFLLNQARGNLQESEMRATAAERRVAMLQSDIRALNGNLNLNGSDGDGNSGSDGGKLAVDNVDAQNAMKASKEQAKLKKKVNSLNESIKAFRLKMKNEIQKLQSDFDKERKDLLTKQYELQDDLNIAKSELVLALEEVSSLKLTTVELSQEVNRIIHQSEKEMNDLKVSHAETIVTIRNEATEIQSFLEQDKSNLKQSLLDEEYKSNELRNDYNRMKRQAAADMYEVQKSHAAVKSTLEKQVLFHRMEVEDRNVQIEALEGERKRIRTLAGLQLGLVKSRIKNRYRKIFRRGKK